MSGDPGTISGADDARGVPDPIRVLVVDDHALFRRGLEMVLAEEPDIELVGEASDGAEAVEKAGEALPDVVLMDIRMPKSSGIEACRAMKEVSPSAKIVMLTISDEEGDLFEAIRAGASGYLLKDIPYDEVADVVRAVLAETGHSQFVVAEVQAAVTASDKQRHRLALWSRRLLGEAITQAQFVLAEHDELVDLVMSSGEGLTQMTEFFDRLQHTHSTRMHELGLA